MADEVTDQTESQTATTVDDTTTSTSETTAATTDATVLGGDETTTADDQAALDAAAKAETDRRAALTDDERTAEDAAAATAAAAPPEKYELALKDAEGNAIELDPAALAAADPVFREIGLNNEQANKLMPVAMQFAASRDAAMIQRIGDMGSAQKKEWLEAFKADPEIGGAKQAETEALAAKGLDALGFNVGHPFRKLLNESGLGNAPDMIRTFRALGSMVAEDGTFARSGETARQVAGWESRYDKDKATT